MSADSVTLLTLFAERCTAMHHAAGCSVAANVNLYLLLARATAANSLHTAVVVSRWDRQMDGPLDTVRLYRSCCTVCEQCQKYPLTVTVTSIKCARI